MRARLQQRLQALAMKGLERLPFADAASPQLPLPRLLRLGLFQVSCGLTAALTAGTLNRVMIVELNVAVFMVAGMLALPILSAPARALIGHRSDQHRSAFGWRRVPYLWNGTLLQFAGLAIMPFALLLLQGSFTGSMVPGRVGAALAFFLLGVGTHTVQTAGLALASDLATDETRPRVVALLYLMLLVGTLISALGFGWVLRDFTGTRLVGVVQGSALLVVALNVTALWKQEARNRERAAAPPPEVPFRTRWAAYVGRGRVVRLLVAVALGTIGFSMQDVLLEPFGGQVLGMSVGQTTQLTALLAAGAIAAFGIAARKLEAGADPLRLAAFGSVIGCFGFAAVIFSAPLAAADLFRLGTLLIGVGGGLFSVGTLASAMKTDATDANGLAVGAWGAVQATAMGGAMAAGGIVRDVVARMASGGAFGPGLTDPTLGYVVVYHLEIVALFAAVVALGPLVRPATASEDAPTPFGLAELPG
jgi:BCD family chlorophyll transporter-like MFS transporter